MNEVSTATAAAKAKAAKKAKAAAAAEAESKQKTTVTVTYVKVYNNMRAGWGMPPILMYAKKPVAGDAPLAPGIISHTKSRVAPGSSVLLRKDIFENFLKSKDGVVHKGLQKLLDNNCLKIIGNKEIPDVRDWSDAPAKIEPSKDDVAQTGTLDVVNSKDLTIDVTRRIEEIELPSATGK